MTSKRISMSLFDDELKSLINASAKIFPITQDMVTNNLNPNNYEYGRIERSIYRWNGITWEYIIADDVEITWTDVQEKPTTFPPSTHTHTNDHTHSNKSIIDAITQTIIDTWNTVTGKADKSYVDTALTGKSDITHNHDLTYSQLGHIHDYASTSHNHDTSYYTETEIDTKLLNKSDSTHNHDGAYYKKSEVTTLLGGKADSIHTHVEADITNLDKYTKSEVDTKLLGKSDTTHGHTDLHNHANKSLLDKLKETTVNADYDMSDLKYIADIRAGYTEGHSHTNKSVLDTITQLLIDGWNSAVTHISDTIKHITSEERILWNTVSGKSDVGHTHDYAPSVHAHDDKYYTETEVNTLLGGKSDTTHNHDANYYTESEINTMMSGKADSTTLSGHTGSTTVHVTQLDKDAWYGKQDALGFTPVNTTDSRLSDARTPLAHTHTKANITDFTHTHTKANITDFPASLPANGGNSDTVDGYHLANRTNYSGVTNDIVVGQLMWKNYANGHTIFDASNSTTPSGTACSNSTPGVAWSVSYPTLMGWNGSSTYGVKVNRADYADSAGSADVVDGKHVWVGAEGSRGSDANTLYFCY